MSRASYKKGDGTSGVRGQLYETKLLSLIFYRAKHDDSIEEFQLASNIADIGAFDDICFKARVKGFAKPLIVSVQAKHKESSEHAPDIELKKYFRSYLKIRERFESTDELFEGDAESYYVIYTSGKDSFGNDAVEGDLASKLNELLDTGGTAKQPYKHKAEVVDSLCNTNIVEDQIISLAKQIATSMNDATNPQGMLTRELMQIYHVVLAQHVFNISEIKPEGHRVATFRQDFFDTRDEFLMLFRDTLYQKILESRPIEPAAIKNLLSEYLAEPTDVIKLSKLIGTVIIYNNGQLEFVKKYSGICKQQLNQEHVPRSTVTEAIEMAAKDFITKELRVPAAFGNKDLTLSGSDAKKERRIKYLASKIIDLLEKCEPSKIVVIDETLEKGFLQLNGGIAGAIGNIFVLDENTKLIKITDDWESLGDLALKLYKQLILVIENLHEFKFYLKVTKFPKLSFDCSAYEERLATDFLNQMLFYSRQADENEVEEILKSKIEDYQRDHPNYFQAKTDAMFLKYHDRIQKWWMQPKQAPYLTKNNHIFEDAINSIIKDPLMSSINVTYMSKIHNFAYTFAEDVASSWNLQDHSCTVVITENSALTVVKLLRHFKINEHVVLDLEYIVNLPTNDRNALRKELTNTSENNYLILICDKIRNSRNEKKALENIAKAVHEKKSVIISTKTSLKLVNEYFTKVDNTVHDENISLKDMSEESQKIIMENARVIFQGKEVRLDMMVDDEFKAYIKGDVLNKIISKQTITIGKLIVNRGFDEIKHLYVDRCVQKVGPITHTPLDRSPTPKTIFDIEDDVVVVTAEPGMGKSTLLTHLSLETKEKHQDVWIVRVNLLEYCRKFNKWKQMKTIIDTLETLKFLCEVILREQLDGNENNVELELEANNGVMYLKKCTGGQWTEFELKLFLHLYNKGKMIFLFDGFDEICPHYMKEVIKCIKALNNHINKFKIWVTSRSYTEVIKDLQREFGDPFEIEHLSKEKKDEYLTNIWKSNLILEEFDKSQLQNVYNFLQFMTRPENQKVQIFELPLQEIYISAGLYMINEIKNTSIPLWAFNKNYDDRNYILEKEFLFKNSVYDDNSDKNPLHLFLRAHFFINRIKDVSHMSPTAVKWNRNVNTFTFYQHYLETKLKTIRFEGKNKMDIYNPDVMIAYDKELADFIAKHKKMAAYAMFSQDIDKLFSKQDVEQVKQTIRFIEKGGEKTGLIYSAATVAASEVPVFIHMTFTEYFAVEYICDLLQHENVNQFQLIDFIFDVTFSGSNFVNVRTIFDYKMNVNKALMTIVQNNQEQIFNLLIEQGIAHLEYMGYVHIGRSKRAPQTDGKACYWPPFEAVRERLHTFRSLFVSIFEKYLDDSNLSDFLYIVHRIGLLRIAVLENCDDLVVCVFDKVKKIDISRLNCVLRQNFCYLSRSRTYDEVSSEHIIQLIRKDYLDEFNSIKANSKTSQRLEWLYQM